MPAPAPAVAAIVLAGGSGTRLGLADGRNKVHLSLGGRPLLAWSLGTLDRLRRDAPLVLVARAGDEEATAAAVAAASLSADPVVVEGGPTRTASEVAGVSALRPGLDPATIVLLHDGARPFVTPALVDRLVTAATRHGVAVPGVPVDPSVVRRGPGGLLSPVEDGLRRVQTPQAVRADVLLAAVEAAVAGGIDAADTAELVAAAGGPAAVVVAGDPDNIKVTRPGDLALAHRLAGDRTADRR